MTLSLQGSPGAAVKAPPTAGFVVVCLCADWCGSCREYRPGFEELASQFADSHFVWIDIEDDADEIGDLDVENFPTLLIRRDGVVVFFGTMLPHLSHLRRTLESFGEQTHDEALAYVLADPLRRSWQDNPDLRALGQV